jgi:hypothetical protein
MAIRTTLRRIAPVALLAAALTACAGSAPAALVTPPGFQPGATADCLLHQAEQPDAAFAGGAAAEPSAQLRFLAYYTAAGRKPFCDGGPATETDRAWARLYVDLTGDPTNVTTVLG